MNNLSTTHRNIIDINNFNIKGNFLLRLLLLMFLLLPVSVIHSYDTYAVEPTMNWEKTILEGYTSSDMQPTSDGGYVITGSCPVTAAPGTFSNVFVSKFNSLGNIEWTNNYGLETHDEWGNKIIQTKDGGYLILGSRSKSSYVTYDPTTKKWIYEIIYDVPNSMYAVKLNALGQLQWQQELGYNISVQDTSVVETDDSGFLICGQEAGGFYVGPLYTHILKLNSQGAVQLHKQLSHLSSVTSINKTNDGGYIFSGFNNGLFVLKLDSSYNEKWNRTITLSGESSYNYSTSVVETSTGFSVAGAGSNSILLGLDKSGQVLWNKTYVNGSPYPASSVKSTSDGGYFFGVNISTQSPATNITIYKVNSNGEKQFEKQLNVNNEELSAVCPTKNDSYIVATNYSKNGKNSIHLMSFSCKPPTPSVKIVDTTDTSAIINLQDSNREDTLYQIKINNSYCTSKGSLTTEPAWISLNKKKVSIIGLLPNTSYNITAKARSVNGLESLNSTSVTLTTLTTEAAAYKQQLLATTNAVVKAEATKQQIYVERALSLVDILPDSTDKVNLLNRLVLVQNTIDLSNATNLVINAETTKQQIDIYRATNLVNALPDSTDKTNLSNRLVSVQNNINNSTNLTIAINAIIMAETTKQQSDVSIARSLIDGLTSETDKANLLNRLSLVQSSLNLTSATNSVIKAEESNQQIDVVIAKNLVDALPDSTDKTTLSNRLLEVQNSINDRITLDNAIKAVIKAEESNLQDDVDRSKSLVEALPDSSDKTNLLGRLLVVQASIDNAAGAVEKAEETKLQEDVDKATALVNKLQSSEDKTKLQNRLLAIQNILDLNSATNAVILAEESKGQLYVDKANTLVSNLKDSIDKLNLIKRLTIVQGYINLSNAQIAVAKAEASLQQVDLDSAKSLAVSLPVSIDRSNLLNRLVNVQYSVNLANARTAVNIAEGSRLQANLDAAVNLVNALPSSSNKTDLLNRLVSLQNVINLANATNAVAKSEATKAQADVDMAKELVTNLPASTSRTNLLNRLEVVQGNIDLIEPTNAVAKAEATNVQADVDTAKELLTSLPASTGRTNLLNRLTVVQNKINLIIATNTVAKAEVTKLQDDVDAAQSLVIALPSSAEKTNLLNRLVNVQYKIDSTNATNAVIKAEESKQQADVDTAMTLVHSLANSTIKTNLLNRLDLIEA